MKELKENAYLVLAVLLVTTILAKPS